MTDESEPTSTNALPGTSQASRTRPPVDLSTRRIVSVAAMTVLGITIFVIALLTSEPNWLMWLFGGLLVFSALAFWTTYALHLHRRRSAR